MPAFDQLAYSDGRCYGMKQADLRSIARACPIRRRRCSRARSRCSPTSCSQKVIGKGPMDRAKCIEYWGSDVEACSEFQKVDRRRSDRSRRVRRQHAA